MFLLYWYKKVCNKKMAVNINFLSQIEAGTVKPIYKGLIMRFEFLEIFRKTYEFFNNLSVNFGRKYPCKSQLSKKKGY